MRGDKINTEKVALRRNEICTGYMQTAETIVCCTAIGCTI